MKVNDHEKAALEALAVRAGLSNLSELLREAVNLYQVALTAKGRKRVPDLAGLVDEAVRNHTR